MNTQAVNDFDLFFSTPKRIDLDLLEHFSLIEILEEPNLSTRREALQIYQEFLESIDRNTIYQGILNDLKGASIQEIQNAIDCHTSEKGEAAQLYGGLSHHITQKEIQCELSMEPIYAGSTYCIYRPFLLFASGRKFVLKRSIKAAYYYHDFFPTNIKEFEELSYKLSYPFSSIALQDPNGIDYYAVSSVVGEGLALKELFDNPDKQKIRRQLKGLENDRKTKKQKKVLQKKLEYVETIHLF